EVRFASDAVRCASWVHGTTAICVSVRPRITSILLLSCLGARRSTKPVVCKKRTAYRIVAAVEVMEGLIRMATILA
ncbi:MAG TPA: hypothetical protein VK638_58130, partial [Edaphobacter sp.]|nr:hypothetical protein [Edaphobacter sp.]